MKTERKRKDSSAKLRRRKEGPADRSDGPHHKRHAELQTDENQRRGHTGDLRCHKRSQGPESPGCAYHRYELSFEYDDAMERGANISELLKKTAQTDDAGQEGENEDE